jgi:hypothetical protein
MTTTTKTTKTTKTTYTTLGSVRGGCGHAHRTIGGALRCLQRDINGCHGQGGYSDRELVGPDGAIPTIEVDGRLIIDPYPGYGEEDALR